MKVDTKQFDDCCELLEKCSYFQKYNKIVNEMYIMTFCSDKEKSKECYRKKIRNETGTPPPANVTPTGKILKD